MSTRKLVVPLACAIVAAYGLVNAYRVEPVKAAWSDWTQGEDGYVSEVITCCWDQLDEVSGGYVELFVGDRGAHQSQPYVAEVYEPGDVYPVATSGEVVAAQDCAWLKFPLTVQTGYSFTKGKRYEFRFTRTSGSDSINYYYQGENPYQYGQVALGGGSWNEPHEISLSDLACRIYGLMRPVDLSYFLTA